MARRKLHTVGILERLAEVVGCKITEFFDEPNGEEIPTLKSGRKPKPNKIS
jgi:hypothetical protein